MELDQKSERTPIPFITILLVAINVVVYLFVERSGSSLDADHMIQMGAMYEPSFVYQHEYYRIITHFFLHFGFDHLFNNMISLLVLGYALENGIGKGWFAFIYMVSGIFAGAVSVAYNLSVGHDVVSCGASGAIYGLMGALFVLLIVKNRHNLRGEAPRFAIYIGLSLYSGMQDPGIDNAAHIGGFVGGILLCIVMCICKKLFHLRKGKVV